MKIDAPSHKDLPALRALWQEAFGDSDAFLDAFEKTAFSSSRSRVVFSDGTPIAALYWFDCSFLGQRLAYLYAVATLKTYRGQGVCRGLMENTHHHLKEKGYAGVLLVPGSSSLFSFYEKMGYTTVAYVDELRCKAAQTGMPLQKIDAEMYAKCRRRLLPPGGVVQEGECLSFLQSYAELYEGEDVLLAVSREGGILHAQELLGDRRKAPAILAALGAAEGHFRLPGEKIPFAMLYPLDEALSRPSYFGIALD